MSVNTLSLVITFTAILASLVKGSLTQSQGDDSFSCFGVKEKNKLKYLYPDSEGFNITIRSSARPESRLLTEIFKILVQEKLNFRVSVLDNGKKTSMDEEEMHRRKKPVFDPRNEEMVWLDKLMPMSQPVDLIDQMEVGHLGPAISYGWYLPQKTVLGNFQDRSYWTSLKDPEKISIFSPTSEEWKILTSMVNKNNIYGGEIRPDICRDIKKCGVALASYPKLIKKQIEEEKMLVTILFFGSRLAEAVEILETSRKGRDRSYLVIHYHPSLVTVKYNLAKMLFPPCTDPLMKRDLEDVNCLYSPNKLAKILWKQIENGAPRLYSFLQRFAFRVEEYTELLQFYNTHHRKHKTVAELACEWLHHPVPLGPGVNTTWYNTWRGHIFKEKRKLYIGGIFPMSGTKYVAPELAIVAKMAVDDVNRNKSMLADYELSLDIKDGKCEPDVVMKKFIDFIKTKEISRFSSTVGVLGPACSNTVEALAGVSKHYRTVVVTYSAKGSVSSGGEEKHPYFFRTVASNRQNKFAMTTLIQRLGWRSVAALTADGEEYTDYMASLQDVLQEHLKVNFKINRNFPPNSWDLSPYLEDLKDRGARIIIGDFYEDVARRVMCQAWNSSMTQAQGYVWLLPGWYRDNWFDIDLLREKQDSLANITQSRANKHRLYEAEEDLMDPIIIDDVHMGKLPNCTTAQMIQALDGHFSMVQERFAARDKLMQTNITVESWERKLNEKLEKINENYRKRGRVDRTKNSKMKIHLFSGYVYDAVWLYGLALDQLLRQDETYLQNLHSNRSVKSFVDIIKNIDFDGVSGKINFIGRSSRLSDIKIMQWYRKKGETKLTGHVIGSYIPNKTESVSLLREENLILEENEICWRTSTEDKCHEKPADNFHRCGILSPLSKYLNTECQLTIGLTFMNGFIVLMMIALGLFFMIKRQYELKMAETEKRMRELGLVDPLAVLALDDWETDRENVVMNRKLGEGAFGMVYGGELCCDDNQWVAVAVKTMKEGSTVDEKIDFLSEAEMMKRFDHKNIVRLLGVCTRHEPIYTIMEFMLYGDLKTYLLARRHLVTERAREECDEVSCRRLTSMAADVSSGLAYLALNKYVHRDVACRNCLVNSDRNVKLADFGMTRPIMNSEFYRFSRKGMLPVRWMSPESLSDGIFTPMSDVWSYGVLLYEIITFGSFPFQISLSNNQVLHHIKEGNTLSPPSGIKQQLSSLLGSCWDPIPTKRPSAAEITELLCNNSRLISPSIDVPLITMTVERTDSLEMMPRTVGGNYNLEYTNMVDKEMLEEEVGRVENDSVCELEECAEHCYLMVGIEDEDFYE